MKPDDGGSAFPSGPTARNEFGTLIEPNPRMFVRLWLTGMVLCGLSSNPTFTGNIADTAIQWADETLAKLGLIGPPEPQGESDGRTSPNP